MSSVDAPNALETLNQVSEGVLDVLSGGALGTSITDAGGEVLKPDDDYMMSDAQAKSFLTMNAIFGSLFVILFFATIV